MTRLGPVDVGHVANWGPGEWFTGFAIVFVVLVLLWAFSGGKR